MQLIILLFVIVFYCEANKDVKKIQIKNVQKKKKKKSVGVTKLNVFRTLVHVHIIFKHKIPNYHFHG